MNKSIILLVLALFMVTLLPSEQVIVGQGDDYSQHIPCDPFYNHSLSQLIYDLEYFPYSGTITQLAFEYQFVTPNPENYINNITVMIGETTKAEFSDGDDWLDLDQFTICYEGLLTQNNFIYNSEEGINLMLIPLQNYFYYSKSTNLVILFLENEPQRGSNADDFIAFTTPRQTSLCYLDLHNPIDINNLGTAQFMRNKLPNTRFEFVVDENYPLPIYPENSSENIELTASLQVIAPQNSNLEFMISSSAVVEHFDIATTFEIISDTLWVITPQLPFSPNTLYEWQVINHVGDSLFNSELFSFTTEESELAFTDFEVVNSYDSVVLYWNSLFANEYPYHIFKNGVILATVENNNWVDNDIELSNSYSYQIKFYFIDGTVLESEVRLVDTLPPDHVLINEEFEEYNAWETNLGDWQNIDNDQAPTYGLTGYNYPHWGEELAFMVFEPSSVTPPLTLGITGDRCLVSFTSSVPPTSDLLISPNFQATQVDVNIFLKSFEPMWGFERVKCGVILNNDNHNQHGFVEGNGVDIPAEMTHLSFTYSVDNSDDLITNFWLESCGVQTSMLIIDRIVISTSTTDNIDYEVTSPITRIYPNPITTNEFTLTKTRGLQEIVVYNIKGQLLARIKSHNFQENRKISLPRSISSGVYLLKFKYYDREELQKITVIK